METWPNLQEVIVTPEMSGNGDKWNVDHGGHNSSSPPDYPHVVLLPGHGPYLIHFVINNPGVSVTFDKADPIWVQPNSKPSSHVVNAQITAVATSAGGKELFVLDKNDNPQAQTLYYRLNTDGHKPVDPIIDNGGHPFTGAGGGLAQSITIGYATFALVLLAALVIGGVLGWVVRRR